MKLVSSKPEQPGTFVIEHQKEKSAILHRKIVIPYEDVLGSQIDDRQIILETYQRPQTFYNQSGYEPLNLENGSFVNSYLQF